PRRARLVYGHADAPARPGGIRCAARRYVRRSPSLVDAWRPLPFSLPELGIGLRRLARHLAETRVQIATGLLALALFTFIGVVHEPVFVDEADNVLGACLMSRGDLVY